jgi:hypothetical protein
VRQQNFSQVIILMVPNALLFALGLLVKNTHPILSSIGMASGGVNVLLGLIGCAALILEQQRWKRFWQETFLGVMAKAERKDDHDLFNRALLLHNYIDSQPNTPVPGSLGFYAVLYSTVQVLLYGLFNLLGKT